MIQLALKHYVFEQCIDVIFSKLFENFISWKHKLAIGDKYDVLVFRRLFKESNAYITLHFYNCTIKKLFTGYESWGEDTVGFTFNKTIVYLDNDILPFLEPDHPEYAPIHDYERFSKEGLCRESDGYETAILDIKELVEYY